MKKVIIIDDEPLARSIVKAFLEPFTELEIIAECENGFDGLKAIEKNQPDLIFLDVQMPKINGFEMLELIDNPPFIIFTTAYDEYAIKAFETSAIDYLLKPFSQERFNQAIDKWLRLNVSPSVTELKELHAAQPDEQLRIVVKDNGEIKIIPTNEVIYIEAYDDYVKIHTKDGYHLKKKTMSHYERSLNPQHFIRIHRSYIINLSMLGSIEPFEKNSYRAILTNKASVSISRSAYPKLKAALGI